MSTADYGGFSTVTLPRPRDRSKSAQHKPLPAKRVRVPLTEAEILKAEDLLFDYLVGGSEVRAGEDVDLIRAAAKRRKIRPSALTVAMQRLGVKTVPVMWEWVLPKEPTVAGARAWLRYQQRQRSSQAQP